MNLLLVSLVDRNQLLTGEKMFGQRVCCFLPERIEIMGAIFLNRYQHNTHVHIGRGTAKLEMLGKSMFSLVERFLNQ